MSSTGTSTCSSSVLRRPGVDDRRPRARPRRGTGQLLERALGGREPDALRLRRGRGRSSRSRLSARWAPRLVAATEWISSTITYRRWPGSGGPALVRSRYSDSGVVIRMSGGCAPSGAAPRPACRRSGWRRRSRRTGSPSRSGLQARCRPAGRAGCAPRRTASALSGETYRTRQRSAGRRHGLAGQPVEAPEEGGEGLAAAGRRRDQRVPAGGDRAPAALLDLGRRRERGPEPLPGRGREQLQGPAHLANVSSNWHRRASRTRHRRGDGG